VIGKCAVISLENCLWISSANIQLCGFLWLLKCSSYYTELIIDCGHAFFHLTCSLVTMYLPILTLALFLFFPCSLLLETTSSTYPGHGHGHLLVCTAGRVLCCVSLLVVLCAGWLVCPLFIIYSYYVCPAVKNQGAELQMRCYKLRVHDWKEFEMWDSSINKRDGTPSYITTFSYLWLVISILMFCSHEPAWRRRLVERFLSGLIRVSILEGDACHVVKHIGFFWIIYLNLFFFGKLNFFCS